MACTLNLVDTIPKISLTNVLLPASVSRSVNDHDTPVVSRGRRRLGCRKFLRRAVFILILAFSGCRVQAAPPNIIFVLTDDQGYGDLSCNGNPVLKTPNLDKLQAESVRFTDFQVSPLCSPSRCALMTGRNEYRSGVSHTRGPGQRMSLQATTIAQVLKSAGYTTGIFGKWHLGLEAPYHPSKRGFDEEFTFLTGMIGEYNHSTAINPILLHNGVNEKTSGYYTDVFFNQAMKWIAGVKGKQPFFAYIATGAPHAPMKCPEEYEKIYADKVQDPKIAKYYGMIANIDDNVGRLVAQLKAWGIERDTLLVFISDNGAVMNAPGLQGLSPAKVFNAGMSGGKNSAHEGGTRVPSFWRWPAGFKGGVDVDQLASNIDFFPTVAELAGAKIPGELKLDGRSLVPLLKDPKAPWEDRFIFIHTGNWGGTAADAKMKGFAVRSNQFRLVENGKLYDIKADRGEKKNVIAEHPDVAAKMRAAYDQYWAEVEPAVEENLKVTGAETGEGGKKNEE